MAKKDIKQSKINIKNKKASHDFLLLDDYTAGIVLTGTEIKSIRAGKASLVDTYCYIHHNEMWVKNMFISHYQEGSYNNHVERRERKLLLQAREIRKILQAIKQPGFSVIPTHLFLNDKGLAKLKIYIARGKKEFDKRETLKEKEDRRDMARAFKKTY